VIKIISNNNISYLKAKSNKIKVLKTEIIFTPLLLAFPVIVALLLINDWYCRGFSMGISAFDGELMIAFIILVGNIVFDIPFVRSLIKFRKK